MDLVVPELQRRGLFRKEYTGATLRANLEVPRPTDRRDPPADIPATPSGHARLDDRGAPDPAPAHHQE